ncbi:MAG TPA: SEC-C metal-binding domain-containing protein [Syntrophales bacterium]|nr:SEC-C metal-binding domain-containing protein [Syntrophales bacterium]
MKTVGRNDPCPCGSGKKYKKCCLMKESIQTGTRLLLVKTSEELIPEILQYAVDKYGEEIFDEAWDEFGGNEQEFCFEDSPYREMFIRWLLFLWIPDEYLTDEEDVVYPSPYTIGAQFLNKKRSRLDSLSAKYLEAALADPLSFWQVEAVEPGRGIMARDLLLGRERFVEDVSSSHTLHKWDILFASTMTVDGVCVFNIVAPFSLPARVAGHVLNEPYTDFDKFEESEAIHRLFDYDYDLIWLYQDMLDELSNPLMPELRNTDGEVMVFTNSIYEFNPSDRSAIIEGMLRITKFECEPGKRKGTSHFTWIEQSTHQSLLENVSKGIIKVRKKYIETECNSTDRDNLLRHKLESGLSGLISHKKTSCKYPSEIAGPGKTAASGRRKAPDVLNLEELPEGVQASIKERMEKMHMKWADTPVPALGNRTPREAVKEPEGKEMVIRLINEWENMQSRMKDRQFVFDFNKLRSSLALPPE